MIATADSPADVIQVDFNPDLFNKVFWHLRAAFMNVAIRYIWLYGGSSASKTYSAVQLTIILMMESEGENTLVLRKFGVDILDSIYSDFKQIIADWGLQEYFIVQQNFIKCRSSGSYVRFRGLDDSEKIKGIANFKRIILEEVSQFDHEDLKQIRKRLRGKVGQQIVGIFNPISEQHWIKTAILDNEELTPVPTDIAGMWVNEKGNLVAMKTNYLDNIYITGKFENGVQVGGFVDQHTIDDFESDKRNDYGYYRVYGLGDWGKLRTGGEFWKDFNTTRHVVQTTWAEDYPLHITWDENVNPFLTCLVWQLYSPKVLEAVQDGKRVADTLGAGITWDGKSYIAIQLDEICLEDPRNRVKDVCTEFKSRYPQHRTKGLFVYGDRTSIKEDTKLEKGENFFTKIMSHVTDYRPTLRMQGANPSVVDSRDFINQCYVNNGGVQIFINLKCKKSLYDYQYALEDSDGTLKKTKKTNPVTKVSFEEFGHPSDAKRYLLTVAFSEQFQIYLRGGRKNSIKLGANNSKNTW